MSKQTFSVVVPTLWRFEPFADVCVDVANHPLVEDVVVINNDSSKQPPASHRLWSHPKIQVLDFGTNLFVNPSWNVGVYYSRAPVVCFWNDDFIFDLRLFNLLSTSFAPTQGVCGFCPTEALARITLSQHTRDHKNLWGFGQLMFIHRKNWVDIPPELLVYCGDNWIFDMQKTKWDKNLLIVGLLSYTPNNVGGTSSRQFVDWVWQERQIYFDLVNKYHINFVSAI